MRATPKDQHGALERQEAFCEQSETFLDLALSAYGINSLAECEPSNQCPVHSLEPVLINDYRNLNDKEREGLIQAYQSEHGVAYFVVLNPDTNSQSSHPLFDIADQLAEDLHLLYPLPHPLEGHREAVSRFGPPDGTVKIYNLPGRGGEVGYREQAETSELFAMHHDGLGSGATVQTVILYMDGAPIWGGFTYFLNVVRIALNLARQDIDAFRSLFLPDALSVLRPRGKGAIKVVTPVLFLNEFGRPQSFFRMESGEYRISWKTGCPSLDRARGFLQRHAIPFANGSSFLHFTDQGHGCLIRNEQVAHGRTAFHDRPNEGHTRVLSRKWFMSGFQHSTYKHVPGIFVAQPYSCLYPEFFGPALLEGEWLYDPTTDTNTRVK